MLCEFCDGLSIRLLVDLAEVEFHARSFPQQAYYQHQPSYSKLIRSSENGCSLCSLILRGFQQIITPNSLSREWEGKSRDLAASYVESQGEVSDIRICLNADHLYIHENLDQIKLFDVLMIQAGTPEHIATSEPSDSEDDFVPPLRLALSIRSDEPKRVGKYRVGRFQLDPTLSSQRNYSIARNWIEECCTLHRDCPKRQASKLPTRVIDVGILDEQQIPRLVVSEGIKARYTTLSHCWGGMISPLLTQDNLKSFQDVIPLADLPANFRDAVSITKELGIQYLWIDSLCIIQDSTEDWEVESKMMGSIYSNALVTISAATSHRSTDGIFRNSPDPKIAERAISLELPMDDDQNDKIQVSLKEENEENLSLLFSKSPLTQRGWTLQEDVLSPRILYYGERQIYWKCPQGFQSADGVPYGTLIPDEALYPAISSLLHSSTLDAETPDLNPILDNYYALVQAYSSRELSFDSDKLPAFSGLAAAIHPVLGGDYLAGIWSGDFRQGLLWYRELRESRHILSDQAPSWSWAVTNDPVIFQPPHRKEAISPHDAQLLDHDVEFKSQNIYGQVGSGRLIVNGLTKRLLRSSQFFNVSHTGLAFVYFDEMEADNIVSSQDVFEVDSEEENYFLSIRYERIYSEGTRKELDFSDIDFDLISGHNYVVLIIETFPEDSDGVPGTAATCLILTKMADTDVYSRVGLLKLDPLYEDSFENWTRTWVRQTITIV